VYFGASQHHMAFPGTLTLSLGTFMAVVEELCESLIHHGFRRILVLNGHGGNDDPIKLSARNIADRTGAAVATASYWNIAAEELAPFQGVEVGPIPGHACGFETSCMLALRPELVRRDALSTWAATDGRDGDYGKRLLRPVKVQFPKQATPCGASGTRGDPTLGSAEKGEKYLAILEERLADFLLQFAAGDVPTAVAAYPGPALAPRREPLRAGR
jgi:creatinine amidohydrolase